MGWAAGGGGGAAGAGAGRAGGGGGETGEEIGAGVGAPSVICGVEDVHQSFRVSPTRALGSSGWQADQPDVPPVSGNTGKLCLSTDLSWLQPTALCRRMTELSIDRQSSAKLCEEQTG